MGFDAYGSDLRSEPYAFVQHFTPSKSLNILCIYHFGVVNGTTLRALGQCGGGPAIVEKSNR